MMLILLGFFKTVINPEVNNEKKNNMIKVKENNRKSKSSPRVHV